MSFFEKLDELITKLDEPVEEVETETIEVTPAGTEEVAEQANEPEDVPANESVEKLSNVVIKQQEHIDRLQKQLAQLINYSGANINDGKDTPAAELPNDEPEEYIPLKDMDFSFKY